MEDRQPLFDKFLVSVSSSTQTAEEKGQEKSL